MKTYESLMQKPLASPNLIRVVMLCENGPVEGLARKFFGEERFLNESEKGNRANGPFDRQRKMAVSLGLIEKYIGNAYQITEAGKNFLAAVRALGVDPTTIKAEATVRFEAAKATTQQ